jgi:hypothetical protein
MNTATTARTLGIDQNLITASLPVTGVKYERGITENLDLGVGLESQIGYVLHAFGKYSFLNRKDNGFSLASFFGAGYGSGIERSKSVYVGPIFSYRKNSFELFASIRANYVSWNFAGLTAGNKDDLITIPSYKNHFFYGQSDLGMNFFNDNWTVTLGAKILMFPRSSAATPFGDIAYKF